MGLARFLVVAVALSGTVSSAVGCGAACDDIGCSSGVSVDVGEGLTTDDFPVEATLCVGTDCVTQVFSEGQLRPGPTQTDPEHRAVSVSMVPSNAVGLRIETADRANRDAPVSLTIRRPGAATPTIAALGIAKIRGQRPGGRGCEVVCHSARLRYDPAAKALVDD